MNSKPPTIPFRIVVCTFSDNLSQNSGIHWYIDTYIIFLFIYLRLYIYTLFLYYRHVTLSSIYCLVVDVVGDFSWGHKIQCIEYTIDWKKSKVCCRERYNRTILYRLEVNSNYKLMNFFIQPNILPLIFISTGLQVLSHVLTPRTKATEVSIQKSQI